MKGSGEKKGKEEKGRRRRRVRSRERARSEEERNGAVKMELKTQILADKRDLF